PKHECCDHASEYLRYFSEGYYEDNPQFALVIDDSDDRFIAAPVSYCPWCGASLKLPQDGDFERENDLSSTYSKVLVAAAGILSEIGMPLAADYVGALAESRISEFVEKAIEVGIADECETLQREREVLQREYAARLIQMRIEYDIAIAMHGSRVAGYNSQGKYAVW